jgi:hypothetical protein
MDKVGNNWEPPLRASGLSPLRASAPPHLRLTKMRSVFTDGGNASDSTRQKRKWPVPKNELLSSRIVGL